MPLLDTISEHARIATAVLPFVVAFLLRLVMGRGRFTGLALTLSTAWFAVNVLLLPFSPRMQQDLMNLRTAFR